MLLDLSKSYITITQDEYDELIEDRRFLEALRHAGVDNWEGYSEALDEDEDDD